MNRYMITTFNCGRKTEIIIEAYDIAQAIQNCGCMPTDIIKAEAIT